jgi:LemA protein
MWILIIILVAVVLYAVILYNKLVRLRVRVKNAWAQIGVQLKRRHDLIPNLVNAVKGYMKYEQETLNKVMEARAKAVSATSVAEASKAEGELSGVLSRLFALFENYPDLKANQNVMALQEELTTTENQISFARQSYNDSVMLYNMALQMFPSNIIASIFNFKEEDKFLETTEAEKEVPKVDLTL